MRNRITAVLLLAAAALLLPQMGMAGGESTCPQTEHTGSLAWSFEDGKFLLFRQAGLGNNFPECAAQPFTCELFPCDTESDSPRSCDEPPVSHCVKYTVEQCTDPAELPTVVRMELEHVGPCE
jgi:hypothetical protein